jgi:hypothetical protein
LHQLADFHEMQEEGHAIKADNTSSFDHTKIADVRTSEVDAQFAPVKVGPHSFYW